jgi:hypothetical protein
MGTFALRASLTGAVVLALAGGGCGDDDSPDRPPQDDATEIRELVRTLQSDYVEGAAESYCSKLTAAGRAQVVRFGRAYRQGTTCESVIATSSQLARRTDTEQRPTKVLAVSVTGDRATIRVSDGGRPPQRIRLVKRDGAWKVPDPGFDVALPVD